jgi:hypothetical protein
MAERVSPKTMNDSAATVNSSSFRMTGPLDEDPILLSAAVDEFS